MIVITDSNIFFSALISPDGVVAKVLNEKKKIQFKVTLFTAISSFVICHS